MSGRQWYTRCRVISIVRKAITVLREGEKRAQSTALG